ncbi:TonB-dependent receptor plug domain-containing protein [Enterobacter hormaechei]
MISKQQIEDKAYRDVTDALRDVPGVVVTGGGSSSDIEYSRHGLSVHPVPGERQTHQYAKHRPNSDNSGIEQGWLPPLESIERIEVIRGPMSSLYGSDAMGGVINVITKKVSNTKAGPVRCMAMQPSRKIMIPAISSRPTPTPLVP